MMGSECQAASASPGAADERRNDRLLRRVVDDCQQRLNQHGFRLEGRGNALDKTWVRFSRPERDATGEDGALILLVAHGRHERAVLLNSYFVDTALQVQTPRARLLQRYQEHVELAALARRVAETICNWPRGAAAPTDACADTAADAPAAE